MNKEPFHKSECRDSATLQVIWGKAQIGITFEQWLGLRDRCRKDLFFLTKSILNWTRVIERVHQPVCDFFPKFNFDGVYHEGYTLEEMQDAISKQSPLFREFLLLDPRGGFKSTIDSCFCVQALLNAPDVRIFIVTGEYDNAVLFLQQIKKYFHQPEDVAPTKLQQLFPEYVIRGRDGLSESPLQCPARIHTEQKEASLWVNAITATLASQHCDIMIGDDVVSDRNSTTPEARVKLKDKYDNAENLLDEWGFKINIGTRYAADDWYGSRISIATEAPLQYFCRAAWTVKKEFLHLPIKELKKEMVDLLFPEKLSWAVLRKKLLSNERDFRNQQLNEPQPDENAVHFEEDLLRSHLEQMAAVPPGCDVVNVWDWAPTSSSKSDYSCGACVHVDKEEAHLHVAKLVFDKWKFSELAVQIVKLAQETSPRVILIEKTAGTELLQAEIHRVAMRLRVATPIMWMNVDNAYDAKTNRIKGLETLLKEDRLFFVQGPWIDETFAQFLRYTGLRKNKGRKDDIPDAVSMAQLFLPKEPSRKVVELTWEEQEAQRHIQEIEMHQAAFNDYKRAMFTAAPTPPIVQQAPARRSMFDMRNYGVQ